MMMDVEVEVKLEEVVVQVLSAESGYRGISPQKSAKVDPMEAFIQACRAGDVQTVEEILSMESSNVDINQKVGVCFQWTGLMYAAYSGHLSVVTCLLAKGADVNVKDEVSHL